MSELNPTTQSPKSRRYGLLPEDVLANLCELLNVRADGLGRAAKMTLEQYGGDTVREVLDTLFNADTSITELTQLILKAAQEPVWCVTSHYVDASPDGNGVRVSLGSVRRAPNPDAAGSLVLSELRDPRTVEDGCSWDCDVSPWVDEFYDCPDGGYVRV